MKEYASTITESLAYNKPIKEALYEGKKEPQAKIVKSQFIREQPIKVTFERLIQYHDSTPQIRLPVSAYRELITGTDMTFNSEDEAATEFILKWVNDTDFYNKLENMTTTLLICGNSILERLSENDTQDVQEVDMSTIIAKKRTDVGELQWYEQRQEQGQVVKLGKGNTDRFIEFNLTHYSQQAWGRSLFYPAAIARSTGDRITAPLVEILWAIEDAAGATIINNGYPIKTITYQGANDKYLEKEAEKWRRYKPGDARIQKIKPEIEFFESSSSAARYDIMYAQINKSIELATQFPTDIMTGDFTSRASSETTENITMKLVRGFQRYICNKLKSELFDPILEQNGFNTETVKLEMAFTTLNIVDLNVDQVKGLVADKVITINEGRMWLRDNTGMELPDDDKIEDKQEQEDELQTKVNDLESKVKQFSITVDTDTKLREIQEKMEHKLIKVKEAVTSDQESLAQRRIKSLEKIIKENLTE